MSSGCAAKAKTSSFMADEPPPQAFEIHDPESSSTRQPNFSRVMETP
jgi:hypothetical protein